MKSLCLSLSVLSVLVFPVLVASQPAPSLPTSPPTSQPQSTYTHVVVVSIDGLRPDGALTADAPTIDRLRAEGAWARNASTIPDSSTLESHSSMLTGDPVRTHGMNFDDFRPARGFIRVPTALYRAHDRGYGTAMFVAKPKLRHIAIPGSLDLFSRPSHACERVASEAGQYLSTARPGLTFIHFGEPDGAGHRRGWMSRTYLTAVTRADSCLATVMSAIEARADRQGFLVIVTADHGGHGRRHGSHRPEDMHIPWIAWGSRVTPGDFDEAVNTMDTAVTAMTALGVPVHATAEGRVVSRALGAPASPTATVTSTRAVTSTAAR